MKRTRDTSPNDVEPNKHRKHATYNLSTLLDFSSLSTHSEISVRFDELAECVIYDHVLCIHVGENDFEYEILELEFYLHKPNCHEDPFTHQSNEQKISGNWHFHRAPTRSSTPSSDLATGYRGGSRKGLDLNLGNPITSPHFTTSNSKDDRIRGGILLRTIRRLNSTKVISGPSLLVDEILSTSKADGISDLVQNKWQCNINALHPPRTSRTSLYIKPRNEARARSKPRDQLYNTPRVGLELSHPTTTNSPTNPRVAYISKPYRYIIHPDILTSNGRGQTFIGIYSLFKDSSEKETDIIAQVARISGIMKQTVQRYVADYEYGVDGNCSLDKFVRIKGGSSSISKYLNMMGRVRSLLDSIES